MSVLPVIEQLGEQCAFLWLVRADAVSQPHYSLADLAKLDSRLNAHLDGLRTAEGWEVALRGAERNEPGEVFAVAVLAFQEGDTRHLQEVLALEQGDPLLSRALVSALGWLPFAQSGPHIVAFLADPVPARRFTGLGAAAVHRADPGDSLQECAGSEYLPLRSRGLRAVGELARLDLLSHTSRYLASDDPEVRFSAAWSTAVLSPDPEALSALASIAQSDSRHRERALQTAMRRADPGAAKVWLRRLAQDSGTLRLAVQGAGAIGDPGEIPWLIEHMKVPELARVAGESFTTITGVDLAHEDLETDRPEGFESGPTEDPADENVELDPDENLPWPDPRLIEKWWLSNRHAFQSGTRHLSGKPITVDWCKQVLRIGRQRQRAAAALELSMRQPGTPLFEVRAPGFRQKQLLGL